MLFTDKLTLPANTAATSPVDQDLAISRGVISWVSVFFPPGCEGLVHLAVYHRDHRIFPSQESMSLTGDRFPIEWSEYYECYNPPYTLKLRGWNEDDTYQHIVTVRIAILPRKATSGGSWVDSLLGLFGSGGGGVSGGGGGGVA